MKSYLFSSLLIVYLPLFGQNVGVGTTTPAYKLDVVGDLRTTSSAYFGSFVGIGTTSPNYKLQVNDGSIAIFNSADVKTWHMNYNSSGNYFQLLESGSPRLVVENGGNVGINTTDPSERLSVGGNANISGTLKVNGALTVNNGKGVLYNLSNQKNVKYYTREAAFTITNLPAHTLSPEGSIGFISGFTQPPVVYVGNIVTTGGTAGPLYQLELVIYNVTATGCKCRLRNVSNSTISQNCTWNIVCIGY